MILLEWKWIRCYRLFVFITPCIQTNHLVGKFWDREPKWFIDAVGSVNLSFMSDGDCLEPEIFRQILTKDGSRIWGFCLSRWLETSYLENLRSVFCNFTLDDNIVDKLCKSLWKDKISKLLSLYSGNRIQLIFEKPNNFFLVILRERRQIFF